MFLVVFGCYGILNTKREEFRYTWVGLNPWNGVEGLAFTVRYFLHTSVAVTYIITVALLFLIWWRLYAIFHRIWH